MVLQAQRFIVGAAGLRIQAALELGRPDEAQEQMSRGPEETLLICFVFHLKDSWVGDGLGHRCARFLERIWRRRLPLHQQCMRP